MEEGLFKGTGLVGKSERVGVGESEMRKREMMELGGQVNKQGSDKLQLYGVKKQKPTQYRYQKASLAAMAGSSQHKEIHQHYPDPIICG
ncbi:hypothetical protein Y1Q_0000594 [Alligator mississippiensis]|uniref:Uncharacterized protein n=1 Tax=Alligator mississippiensis TaxID=8496 RepID=A0A151MBZ6_ALLMI|nr:hypothetical protein Y1Q_0000594 [Alligator mississippiensis]